MKACFFMPAKIMLLEKNATVTICHSRTKNLAEFTKKADLLVVAIGKKCFIKEDMVKDGAIVVDVGTNRVEDKLYGDVDFEMVKDKTISFLIFIFIIRGKPKKKWRNFIIF